MLTVAPENIYKDRPKIIHSPSLKRKVLPSPNWGKLMEKCIYGKNLCRCQFFSTNPHKRWPGIETGPPWWLAGT